MPGYEQRTQRLLERLGLETRQANPNDPASPISIYHQGAWEASAPWRPPTPLATVPNIEALKHWLLDDYIPKLNLVVEVPGIEGKAAKSRVSAKALAKSAAVREVSDEHKRAKRREGHRRRLGSRELQSSTYRYRAGAPLVLPFLYRLKRLSLEDRMQAAADDFFKEYQKKFGALQ
jgi:hypothetical protein